jgi:serine/threonine protein kinase
VTTLGDFSFERVVGRGATATVWRARRRDASRPVAVKRARPDVDPAGAAARLRHEAAVLAALHHPHVVPLLELVDHGDEVALVLPLAEAGTVADLLASRGPLALDDALALVAPLADALAAVHRAGFLHRDVSPHNLLLTPRPLLADFGDAAPAARPDGRRPGTPGWVDPAVAAGGTPGTSSDVYALAAVAATLLGGPAADLPGPLQDLLDASLDPDPSRRPADGPAFAAALRAVTDAATATVLPATVAMPVAARRPAPATPGTPAARTVEFDPPRPSAPAPVAAAPGAAAAALAALAVVAALVVELATVPRAALAPLLAWQSPAALLALAAGARTVRHGWRGATPGRPTPSRRDGATRPGRGRGPRGRTAW